MSEKATERAIHLGAGLLAVVIIVVLFVSPLEAIWTAAIIFGVAALALGIETLLLSRRRRRRHRGHHGSAHSASSV